MNVTNHPRDNNAQYDLAAHITDHSPENIQRRINRRSNHHYLRDFVYGAVDGTVTTFAVISGVNGAGLASGIILILGTANLIGDGFSMAAGNYLSTQADEEFRDKARRREKRHIEMFAEGEREEIRQIFSNKGFSGKKLDQAVDIITEDTERWVDTMLKDELGLSLHGPIPLCAASTTFAAFMLVGVVPLLPFIYEFIFQNSEIHPFAISTILTGMTFFCIGAVKSRFVERHWCSSGLETLVVGGCAAGLAYLVGAILKNVVQI